MREALQILAVEDEKAVAQILAVVLGGPMAKVTRAADGWEALIKIAASAHPFDVVITDHRMPRMGGLELVRRAYEELEVDMMMSKPFEFAEIQNAVAILTKGRRRSLTTFPRAAASAKVLVGFRRDLSTRRRVDTLPDEHN